jgi:low affinity Fe/Cu permease
MPTILNSAGSGSAMRDLDPDAIRPWRFASLARHLSSALGRPAAFAAAVAFVLLWGASGPVFGYSDTWQLVVNTSTTIVTFLMVFIIQNTQNRDTTAIQIKLDELIRATQGAHNAILDLEELDDEQLAAYLKRYEALASVARGRLQKGRIDTNAPELRVPR